ncbi:MAG: hypothetical protein WCR21_11265, partial [Bacteroidota bacterium]
MIILLCISIIVNAAFVFLYLKWRKHFKQGPKQKSYKLATENSKQVGAFYDAQTDNFLKIYGDVIQAFRTKNVSILLDHQIEAMQLSADKIVLDAGCGVCGPAIYFAKKTGLKIEALSISGIQVEKAKQNILKNSLDKCVHVQEGDY